LSLKGTSNTDFLKSIRFLEFVNLGALLLLYSTVQCTQWTHALVTTVHCYHSVLNSTCIAVHRTVHTSFYSGVLYLISCYLFIGRIAMFCRAMHSVQYCRSVPEFPVSRYGTVRSKPPHMYCWELKPSLNSLTAQLYGVDVLLNGLTL
jgi:hypothetical protein